MFAEFILFISITLCLDIFYSYRNASRPKKKIVYTDDIFIQRSQNDWGEPIQNWEENLETIWDHFQVDQPIVPDDLDLLEVPFFDLDDTEVKEEFDLPEPLPDLEEESFDEELEPEATRNFFKFTYKCEICDALYYFDSIKEEVFCTYCWDNSTLRLVRIPEESRQAVISALFESFEISLLNRNILQGSTSNVLNYPDNEWNLHNAPRKFE